MKSLNLGILAHVDAGKTSLTERLLHAAGVIDAVGSVDHGDTQTDTLELERERGITIKSAVVSFTIDDLTVNLIDTPGHPDFIAEVDRVLQLLDGAVLVVSAVEGVQAQTRVLMRALQRQRIPTLIFVNKVDRRGADPDRVVGDIQTKLSPSVIPLSTMTAVGTRAVTVDPIDLGNGRMVGDLLTILAEHDESMLVRFVDDDRTLDVNSLIDVVAGTSQRGELSPVLFGSALTGAGVDALIPAITRFLPAPHHSSAGRPTGVVFKIERSSDGARWATVRMTGGTLRSRQQILVRGRPRRVTGIGVFAAGGVAESDVAVGGQIARIRGLGDVRIGDTIGPYESIASPSFAPPPFEAVVCVPDVHDRGRLRSALDSLAEDDPLIDVRQDERRGELSVSLYGDVQREVISETLRRDFGVVAEFGAPTVVCIERVAGAGEATELMPDGRSPNSPLLAGLGVRVEPAPKDTGIEFSPGVQLGRLPLAFVNAVAETVPLTLGQGLHGWDVSDCRVTMIYSGYWPRQSRAHGTFDKNMSTTAGDFRLLTPLVLMAALRAAGTTVHEPVHRFHIEAPTDTIGALTRTLVSLGAELQFPPLSHHDTSASTTLAGLIPVAGIRELRKQLPGLTRGDGFVETTFDSHRPVRGRPPTRARTDLDPLDRAHYLRNWGA